MAFELGGPFAEQFFDSSGDPLVNGTIEFFVWNTTTPTPIYSDSIGTAIGTSVTLGNIGQPINSGTNVALFFDTDVTYKIVRKDASGTEIGPTLGPFSVGIDTSAENFTTSLTGGVARTLQSKLQDIVSVKDFGVTGDGNTDDTTALQAAIDGAVGLYLYFPSGKYLISSALTINGSGCRGFLGVTGRAPRVLDDEPSRIFSTSTTANILTITTAEFYCEKIAFRYQNTPTDDPFTMIDVSQTNGDIDCVFSYCTFSDFDVAIHHKGRGLKVANCEFESGNTGIKLDFDSTIADGSTFGSRLDDRFRAITISDSRFHSIDTECIQNTGTDASNVLAMVIADNQCDGGSQVFYRGALRYSNMTGNVVHNINADSTVLRLTGTATDSVIANNVFLGKVSTNAVEADLPNQLIKIESAATRLSICDNHLGHCVIRGIAFESTADNCIVSSNVFYDAGQNDASRSAIGFDGNATECIVTGNTFEQPTGTALNYFVVFGANRTNCVVKDNTLDRSRHTDQVDDIEIVDSGAISLEYPVTYLQTTGAVAQTLADGVEGQEKWILMTTDGGDGTLTPSNLFAYTTITFNDVGDSVMLRFSGSSWVVVANEGCTLA